MKSTADKLFRRDIRRLSACLALLALWGCNLSRAGHALPTASPSPVDSPNSWIAIAPGIEVREMDLPVASLLARGTMVVVRLDPAAVTLRVHYTPGEAQSLAEWQERLPDARIIVNGAFFDEANRALGLLVSDGQAFGQSFAGFGGMLQVDGAGMRVRSLVTEPYQGESLWQAVQAFPLLLEGGTLAAQGPGFDERSRRTWVGQDRSGRVLFGATHNLIGLADLQAWLLAADLDVMIAFALDGGRSTGMAIRTPGYQRILPSFDRLPSVIALYTP